MTGIVRRFQRAHWLLRTGLFWVLSGATVFAGAWWASVLWTLLFAKLSNVPPDRLGLSLSPRRLRQLLGGLALGTAMVLAFCAFFSASFHWERNHAVASSVWAGAAWFYLRSAIVEELLFRGFGFQTLIDATGFRTAQALTAIAFAAYHVFNAGMPPLQAILFTSPGSLLFGYAFQKSRGVALPIGIHAAWNFWQEQLAGSSGRGQPGIWHPIQATNERLSVAFSFGVSMSILLLAAALIAWLYSKTPAVAKVQEGGA